MSSYKSQIHDMITIMNHLFGHMLEQRNIQRCRVRGMLPKVIVPMSHCTHIMFKSLSSVIFKVYLPFDLYSQQDSCNSLECKNILYFDMHAAMT